MRGDWRQGAGLLLVGGMVGCAAGSTVDVSAAPGMAGSGDLVQPYSSPAPGGGSTAYPAGTVFATGTVRVTIGPGGVVTPAHVYLRPNTTTIITNQDTVTRSFVGFGGATDVLGPIAPGESFTKGWHYPGTWAFRDASGVTFTVTDVPE